jgi:hypothetical protein
VKNPKGGTEVQKKKVDAAPKKPLSVDDDDFETSFEERFLKTATKSERPSYYYWYWQSDTAWEQYPEETSETLTNALNS